MNNYTINNCVKTCRNNDKGFLYALVKLESKASWDNIDYSEDKDFHLNNDIDYIGITSNLMERFSQHRNRKSNEIGMIVFNQTKTEFPEAELKALEAEAIFNYCLEKGVPKWQKGASTFSGA
jgi:predicted GIY-YIG superfamily endonuclease